MTKLDLDGKVAVLGAIRLPIGAIGGGLSGFLARELATLAIKGVLEKAGIAPETIQYTTAGWVMQDPRSPNVAKTAAEFAGVPNSVPGTTIHENCASGAAAVHDLARRILLGEVEIGVAVGVESMSNVARYLYAGRLKNQMYGDMTLEDGVMGALVDKNVGPKGEVMGLMTERLVEKYGVTREAQDDVAFSSHFNAIESWEKGFFNDYVIPVSIPQKKGDPVVFAKDEGPKKIEREVFAKQRPYFKPEGGTITAMNSSSINDGAAALLLASRKKAEQLGRKPLAYLLAFHNVGVPRELMGEGAFKVIPPLLQKAGLGMSDIDFFELNEAFAAVVAAAYHDIPELKKEKVNQWGSGISLGHPVGCTGARQIADMVHQLAKRDRRIGLTSRCVGGGIGNGEIVVAV
ncbi:MAG: thiolase family protein [Deltaproteobacteria bacterium]|nr:thiolase family protein [Deltaproteobacteria bacterium]